MPLHLHDVRATPLPFVEGPLVGRKVLIIDDEAMVRRSFHRLLGRLGVEVMEADGGAAGLELLATHSVDALFVDLSMPDMPGQEVVQRARAQHAHLPVFVMSGLETSLAELPDADEIIPKPFTTDEVRDALMRHLH